MTDRAEFRALMHEVAAKAHDGADLWVIRPGNQMALLFQALSGDATAGKLIAAVTEFLETIRAGTRGTVQCGLCGTGLSLAMGVIAVVLVADQTAPALCIGVCQACARRDDVRAALLDVLRQVWPELKTATHNTPGHA